MLLLVLQASGCEKNSGKSCEYRLNNSTIDLPCAWIESSNAAENPFNIVLRLYPFFLNGELEDRPAPGQDFTVWLTARPDPLLYGDFFRGFHLGEQDLQALGPLPTDVVASSSLRPEARNRFSLEVNRVGAEWVITTYMDSSFEPLKREQASEEDAVTWWIRFATTGSDIPDYLKSCHGRDYNRSCLIDLRLSGLNVHIFLHQIPKADHDQIVAAVAGLVQRVVNQTIDLKARSIPCLKDKTCGIQAPQ
jgi:hypothetical protein